MLGAGVGGVSSFNTHPRWLPVTQNTRSRRSYGIIEDCEESMFVLPKGSFILSIVSPKPNQRNEFTHTSSVFPYSLITDLYIYILLKIRGSDNPK